VPGRGEKTRKRERRENARKGHHEKEEAVASIHTSGLHERMVTKKKVDEGKTLKDQNYQTNTTTIQTAR